MRKTSLKEASFSYADSAWYGKDDMLCRNMI